MRKLSFFLFEPEASVPGVPSPRCLVSCPRGIRAQPVQKSVQCTLYQRICKTVPVVSLAHGVMCLAHCQTQSCTMGALYCLYSSLETVTLYISAV